MWAIQQPWMISRFKIAPGKIPAWWDLNKLIWTRGGCMRMNNEAWFRIFIVSLPAIGILVDYAVKTWFFHFLALGMLPKSFMKGKQEWLSSGAPLTVDSGRKLAHWFYDCCHWVFIVIALVWWRRGLLKIKLKGTHMSWSHFSKWRFLCLRRLKEILAFLFFAFFCVPGRQAKSHSVFI